MRSFFVTHSVIGLGRDFSGQFPTEFALHSTFLITLEGEKETHSRTPVRNLKERSTERTLRIAVYAFRTTRQFAPTEHICKSCVLQHGSKCHSLQHGATVNFSNCCSQMRACRPLNWERRRTPALVDCPSLLFLLQERDVPHESVPSILSILQRNLAASKIDDSCQSLKFGRAGSPRLRTAGYLQCLINSITIGKCVEIDY